VRHRQRRVDGRGRAQQVPQDVQDGLVRGPGRLREADDPRGNVPEEQGDICQYAGPRRAKERLG
jgi:hypothetical protein